MKKLFLLTSILMLVLGCSKKEEAIFILPEDYTGYIIILYNQENGSEVKYENNARVYEIPKSGILKTKFDADYGWSQFPKFYYDNDKSKEIKYYYDFNEIPSDEIVSYGSTTGNANRDLKGESTVSFSQHYVGTKEQIKIAIEKANTFDYVKLANE